MEANSKQEDYQCKLARDMHNFYHDVGNDSMPMVGITMEMETTLLKDIMDLPPQRVSNVEIMKPSMIEEFSTVNKLPQAQEVVEESIVIHVVEETSNEDPCDCMNEKSIGKEECNEFKEKERGEEKEILVERSCTFDSISSLSKESELLECSKEKESELEKRIEDKGRDNEKELGANLEQLPIRLSINPSLICYEDSLLHSGSVFDPSCYDLGVMNNASIESRVVGFRLDEWFSKRNVDNLGILEILCQYFLTISVK
ncbi:hypothetical protein M9H77_11715 [Catharanthus roseus]|uniref:Uncharacterized protein n=1 Tax=Catharanthus roseus TaxID=4058 RepID=A0ACC0BFF3_CATRO|nr:hypothetical protein M9H77_11715 [Catharanthus roseus]